MSLVANATATWISASRQPQAKYFEELGDNDERDVPMSSSLDQTDPRRRQSDSAANRRLAEITGDTSLPKLANKFVKQVLAAAAAAVACAFSRRHPRIVAGAA